MRQGPIRPSLVAGYAYDIGAAEAALLCVVCEARMQPPAHRVEAFTRHGVRVTAKATGEAVRCDVCGEGLPGQGRTVLKTCNAAPDAPSVPSGVSVTPR